MSIAPEACPVSPEFDPFGAAFQRDPGGSLKEDRLTRPVFYSPVLDYYVITRHEDIRLVLNDNTSYSPQNVGEPITPLCPAAIAKLEEHDYVPSEMLGQQEEPLHMQRRKKLDEPYSNANVAAWEKRIREVFTGYIDAFVDRGHADLRADLFWLAPAVVALEFMGLPPEEVDSAKQFAAGIDSFVFGRPTEEEQVASCDLMGRHRKYSIELIEKMMPEPDGPGALRHAIRAYHENPDLFQLNHLYSTAIEDLSASHKTTAYTGVNGSLLLLRHRHAWEELCPDPTLIPNAVEECLRMGPPLVCWRRRTVMDVTVGGYAIPAGGNVLLVLGSGNRDESVFDDPDTFDIHRKNARRHLSFGVGSHACIGSPLARLQLKVAFEELTRRLPGMRLVEDQTIEHIATASARAPKALLVEW